MASLHKCFEIHGIDKADVKTLTAEVQKRLKQNPLANQRDLEREVVSDHLLDLHAEMKDVRGQIAPHTLKTISVVAPITAETKPEEPAVKPEVPVVLSQKEPEEAAVPSPEPEKSAIEAVEAKRLTDDQIASIAVRQQPETPQEVVADAVNSALENTAAELKKQKTFLIEHIDEAIKDAPEFTEDINKKIDAIVGLESKAKQAYDRAAELRGKKADEAEIAKALEENGALHKQIKEVQASIPSVTIEVPNDGNFTVYNNQETLKKFKDIVGKKFPTTPEKESGVPHLPTDKAHGYRAPSKLEEGIAFKIDGKPAYTDGHILLMGESKAIPETPSKTWGDGKESLAARRAKLSVSSKEQILARNEKDATLPVDTIKFVTFANEQGNANEGYGITDEPVAGSSSHTVLMSGNVSAAINTDYYQHIINSYPDATFKLGQEMSKGDNIASVGVYDNGKQVGVVMPLRSEAVALVRDAEKEVTEQTAKVEVGETIPAEKPIAAAEAETNAVKPETKQGNGETITDFGQKIGGARKDTAESGYVKGATAKTEESGPAWQKRFKTAEKTDGSGRFTIIDTKEGRFSFSGERQTFATEAEAEAAIPIYAVAKTHHVYENSDKTWSIYKRVGDRKRFKIVQQDFASREEAMKYMAVNAEKILNTKTTFGEEILPVPEIAVRKGVERRTEPADSKMFMHTFAPRGIEFGNWNNQEERQQVMNHAYDGLLDLSEVLGVPPKALMLNGDLALAFGARGQGLSGAKAHYETTYGVINLTKMSGAGSLAHEWLHAADHYLGRLDTKASSEKVANKRGDMVYKSRGDSDLLSNGISYNSQLRPEVQEAYKTLIQTMYKKAEQYVEDTKQADKFVGTARERLKGELDGIRNTLAKDLAKEYTWRKSKRGLSPASAEQLAAFDKLANILAEGGDLETKYVATNPNAPVKRHTSLLGRRTNDTLEGISSILKDVRNYNGFNTKNEGVLDRMRASMGVYSARLKMLTDAQSQTEKTKQVPTSFAMEAKKMDQARTGDYWSEPHEMAARAFAAYVEDKVAAQGGQSDFLVYHAHGGILVPMIDGFIARPYPEGKEREAVNKAFDNFIQALKTRETEKGVALYERLDLYNASGYNQGYEDLSGTGRTDLHNADGFPEVVSKISRSERTGVSRVDSADSAAQLAQFINRYPQERLAVILTTKSGDIIAVHEHTIGTKNSTLVDPALIVGQALNTPGVEKFWMIHQHPSGIPTPSSEDRLIADKIKNLADKSDVVYAGSVVLGSRRWASVPDVVTPGLPKAGVIKPVTGETHEIPVVERTWKTRGAEPEDRAVLNSSGIARKYALQVIPKGGVIFTGAKTDVLSTLPLPTTDWSKIRGAVQNRLLKEFEKRNAIGFIVFDPNRTIGPQETQNIVRFAKQANLHALDVLDNAKSARDSGLLHGTGEQPFYSITQPASTFYSQIEKTAGEHLTESVKPDGLKNSSDRQLSLEGIPVSIARAELSRLQLNNKNISVVGDEHALPDEVKRDILSMNASGQVEGVFYQGEIYVVASNLASRDRVQYVARHELTHRGLRNILGNEIKPVFRQIFSDHRAEVEMVAKEYGLDVSKPGDRLTAVDEFVARNGEHQLIAPSIMQRIIAMVRNALRKMGFTIKFSDNDITAMAGAAIKAGGTGGEGPLYLFAGSKAMGFEHTQGQLGNDNQPSNLNAFQREQVATPEFMNWFGESKVVDENGEPVVVYHGTQKAGFDEFKNINKEEWQTSGHATAKLGFWFSEDKGVANEFAVPRTGVRIPSEASPAIYQSYLKLENPKHYDTFADLMDDIQGNSSRAVRLKNRLMREGYDGIIIDKSNTDFSDTRKDFIVFEPSQIKSSTGNTGAFDARNPDIRFMKTKGDTGNESYQSGDEKQNNGNTKETKNAERPWLAGETVADARGDSEGIKELRSRWSDYLHRPIAEGDIKEVSVHGPGSDTLRGIAGRFGKEVKFFRNLSPELSRYEGLMLPKNERVVWINVHGSAPHLLILGHELMHHLQYDNKALFHEFYAAIKDDVNKMAYMKYNIDMRNAGAYENDTQLFKEWSAEFMGQKFIDEKFWDGLAQKNPSLVARIMEAIKSLLDQVTGRVFGRDIDHDFMHDINRARQIAIDTMAKYADSIKPDERPDGNPVFSIRRDDFRPAPKEMVEKLSEEKPKFQTLRALAADPKDFINKYRNAFNDKDIGEIEKLWNLPHWIGQQHPEFGKVMDVEENRQESRSEITHDLTAATLKKNEGQKNEFLSLPADSKLKVSRYILESDAENRVITNAEMSDLTPDEKSAYWAWKKSMDNALETRMQFLDRMNLLPYKDQPWYDTLEYLSRIKGAAKADVKAGQMTEAEADVERARYKEEAVSKLPDNEVAAFEKAYGVVMDGRTKISGLRNEIKAIKFYMPRVREGEYVVSVYDKSPQPEKWNTKKYGEWRGEKLWEERATTKSEGVANLMRLEQEHPGMTVVESIDKRTPEEIYQQVNDIAIEKFVEKALSEAKGISEDDAVALRDAMLQSATNELRERGWEKHGIHRGKDWVGGYKTDHLDDNFVSYMTGLAGSLTKMEAAYHYAKALEGIDMKSKPNLFGYANQYVKDLTRNQTKLDRLSGKAKNVAFTYYITGKLSMAAVQITQNFVTGIPQLSRYTKSAGMKYNRAMRDVAMNRVSPEEKALLTEFHDKGLDQAKFMEDIMGKNDANLKGTLAMIERILAMPFTSAETFNRKSALIAAYRVFRDPKTMGGAIDEEAFKRAKAFVNDTHFLMGKANKPEWARGASGGHALANTAYTFASFTHNYALGLVDAFKRGGNAQGLKVLGRSLAWLAIFGGLPAIPFIDDLLDELEKLTGIAFRTNMRKALRGAGGEYLEKFGMQGIPALLGADISGSLKTGIPLKDGAANSVYGVYGGLKDKAVKGFNSVMSGDYLRGVENLSPLFIENLMKAVRMATQGATTTAGKVMFDDKGKPITLTPVEAAGQTLGFRPARTAEFSQEHQTYQNIKTHFDDKRKELYQEFRLARAPEDKQVIMRKVRQYNSQAAKYKGAVPLITGKTLQQALTQKPDKKMLLFERATQ